MKKELELRTQLTDLFASTGLAVLSTHNEGQPYASLVAFAATDDLHHLIFATGRSTRKYANLKADGRVALLIDNRTNSAADFRKAVAATATGRARDAEDPEKKRLVSEYLKRHPHLEEFVNAPTCALLKVTVDAYYIVSRFQQVMELHMK